MKKILLFLSVLVTCCSCNFLKNEEDKNDSINLIINDMNQISYKEYVELIYYQKDNVIKNDLIVIFTQEKCDFSNYLYCYTNELLKMDEYKQLNIPLYNVDLSLNNDKTSFKDKTIGSYGGNDDYLKQLDNRIVEFYESFYDGYDELIEVASGIYTFVSTPLIIWYSDGIETRISNTLFANIDINNATISDYFEYITNFDKYNAGEWNKEFDLSYKK